MAEKNKKKKVIYGSIGAVAAAGAIIAGVTAGVLVNKNKNNQKPNNNNNQNETNNSELESQQQAAKSRREALDIVNKLDDSNPKKKEFLLKAEQNIESKEWFDNLKQEAAQENNAENSRIAKDNEINKEYLDAVLSSLENSNLNLHKQIDAFYDQNNPKNLIKSNLENLLTNVKDEKAKIALQKQIDEQIATTKKQATQLNAALEELISKNDSNDPEMQKLKKELEKTSSLLSTNPTHALRLLNKVANDLKEVVKQKNGEDASIAVNVNLLMHEINNSNLTQLQKDNLISDLKKVSNDTSKLQKITNTFNKLNDVANNKKELELEKAIEDEIRKSTSDEKLLDIKKKQLINSLNNTDMPPVEKEKLINEINKILTLADFEDNKERIESEINDQKQKDQAKELKQKLNELQTQINNDKNIDANKLLKAKKAALVDQINNSNLKLEQKQKLLDKVNQLDLNDSNATLNLENLKANINNEVAFEEEKNRALEIINQLEKDNGDQLNNKLNNLSSSNPNELQKLINEAKNTLEEQKLNKVLEEVRKLNDRLDSNNNKKNEFANLLNQNENLTISDIAKISEDIKKELDAQETKQVEENKSNTELAKLLVNNIFDESKKQNISQKLAALENNNLDNEVLKKDLNDLASNVQDAAKLKELQDKIKNVILTDSKLVENKIDEINELTKGLNQEIANQFSSQVNNINENSELSDAEKLVALNELQKKLEGVYKTQNGSNALLDAKKAIQTQKINNSNLTPEQKNNLIQSINQTSNLEEFDNSSNLANQELQKQNELDVTNLQQEIDEAITTQSSSDELLEAKKELLIKKINDSNDLTKEEKNQLLEQVDNLTQSNYNQISNEINDVLIAELNKARSNEIASEINTIVNEIKTTIENQSGVSGLANSIKEATAKKINDSNLSQAQKDTLLARVNSVDTANSNAFSELDAINQEVLKELGLQSVKDAAINEINKLNDPQKTQLLNEINQLSSQDIEVTKQKVSKLQEDAKQILNQETSKSQLAINKLAGNPQKIQELETLLAKATTQAQKEAVEQQAIELLNNQKNAVQEEINKLSDTDPLKAKLQDKLNKAKENQDATFATFANVLEEAQAATNKQEQYNNALEFLNNASNINEEQKAALKTKLDNANDIASIQAVYEEIQSTKILADTKQATTQAIATVENQIKKSEFETELANADTKEKLDQLKNKVEQYAQQEKEIKQKVQQLTELISVLNSDETKQSLKHELDQALLGDNSQPNSDLATINNKLDALRTKIDEKATEENRIKESLEAKKAQLEETIATITDETKKAELQEKLSVIKNESNLKTASAKANELAQEVEQQKEIQKLQQQANQEIAKLRVKDSDQKAALLQKLANATTQELLQNLINEAIQAQTTEAQEIETKKQQVLDEIKKLSDSNQLKSDLISQLNELTNSNATEVDLSQVQAIQTQVTQKLVEIKEEARAAIALTQGLDNSEDGNTNTKLMADLENDANQNEVALKNLINIAQNKVQEARSQALVEVNKLSDNNPRKQQLINAINDSTNNISQLKDLLQTAQTQKTVEDKKTKLKEKINQLEDEAQRNRLLELLNDPDTDNLDKLNEIEQDIAQQEQSQEQTKQTEYQQALEAINNITNEDEKNALLARLNGSNENGQPNATGPKENITLEEIRQIKAAADAQVRKEEPVKEAKKQAKASIDELPTNSTIAQELQERLNNATTENEVLAIQNEAQAHRQELDNAITAALEKAKLLPATHPLRLELQNALSNKKAEGLNTIEKINTLKDQAIEAKQAYDTALNNLNDKINSLPEGNELKNQIKTKLAANDAEVDTVEKLNELFKNATTERNQLNAKIAEALTQINQLPDGHEFKQDNVSKLAADSTLEEFSSTAKIEEFIAKAAKAKTDFDALKANLDTELTKLPVNNPIRQQIETAKQNSENNLNTTQKVQDLITQATAQRTALNEKIIEALAKVNELPDGHEFKQEHASKLTENSMLDELDSIEKIQQIIDNASQAKTQLDNLKANLDAELAKLPATNNVRTTIETKKQDPNNNLNTPQKVQELINQASAERIALNNKITEALNVVNTLPTNNDYRVEMTAKLVLNSLSSELDSVDKISVLNQTATQKKAEYDAVRQAFADEINKLSENNSYRTQYQPKLNDANDNDLDNKEKLDRLLEEAKQKVDEERREAEFGPRFNSSTLNNPTVLIEEPNSVWSENKTWADTSKYVMNVLPSLGDNEVYREISSDTVDITRNDLVQSGVKTYVLYRNNQATDTKYTIYGEQINNSTSVAETVVEGNALRIKNEYSMNNGTDKFAKLIDRGNHQGNRWDNWFDKDRQITDYFLTLTNANESEDVYSGLNVWYLFGIFSNDGFANVIPSEIRIQTSLDGQTWTNVQNQDYAFASDWFNNYDERTATFNTNNFKRVPGSALERPGGSQNNNTLKTTVHFNPIRAKYVKIIWKPAIDKTRVSSSATGNRVFGLTEIKLLKVTDQNTNAAYRTKYEFLFDKNVAEINAQYNAQTISSLQTTTFSNIIPKTTFDLNDIVVNNENNPKLKYEKELLKTYKEEGQDNITYALVAIKIKNGWGELVHTYYLEFGNRPINLELFNTEVLMQKISDDMRDDKQGVLRRMKADLNEWKTTIENRSESTLNPLKTFINEMLTNISSDGHDLTIQEVSQWLQAKGLITNIIRENNYTNTNAKYNEIEQELEKVRIKWNEINNYLVEQSSSQTNSPAKIAKANEIYNTEFEQFYNQVHQPMMNDRSKTVADLQRHLLILENKMQEFRNQIDQAN